MASTTQDLAFDALGAAGYTGTLTERLYNWRVATSLTSWTTYRDYIITNGAVGSNFMDAQRAFWTAGLNPVFDPLTLSPAAWYDFSDGASITLNTTTISQINDKSGNARHLVQATAAQQPTAQAAGQNGLATGLFAAASDQYMTYDAGSDAITFSGGYAQFVVARITGLTGSSRRLFAGRRAATTSADYQSPNMNVLYSIASQVIETDSAGTAATGGSAISTTAFQATGLNNGTQVQSRVNGVAGTANAASVPSTLRYLRVGSSTSAAGTPPNSGGATEAWQGHICEVIFCTTAVSGANITACEAYLKTKWGTP